MVNIGLCFQPENILMANQTSDQIKICDFGNAIKISPKDVQYCKYGTPEFIAPEIVNQAPVSKATDIWYKSKSFICFYRYFIFNSEGLKCFFPHRPVGVITYLW